MRGERPEPGRCEEIALGDRQDRLRLGGVEEPGLDGERDDRVRTDGRIAPARRAVGFGDDVVGITAGVAPEATPKREEAPRVGILRANRELDVAERRGEVGHRVAGACPERLQLDGKPRARSHRPIADPRVHPGEREPRVTGREEPFRGHADVVPGARDGSFEGADQGVEELVLHERVGQSDHLDEETRRLEEPQRRIGGVELGGSTLVRQPVRDETVLHVPHHRAEHLAGSVGLAVDQEKAGKRKKGVAAPDLEPRVAGDDGGLAGPVRDERVTRDRETAPRARVKRARIVGRESVLGFPEQVRGLTGGQRFEGHDDEVGDSGQERH